MKKYAKGREVFLCIFCLFFMIFLISVMAYSASAEFFLLGFIVFSCLVFPFYYYLPLFCLFRLRKCYYMFDDNSITISLLIAKKRQCILDVYYVNNHIRKEYTMQPVMYEINYSDVLKIVCLGEIKKSVRGLYSTDVCFVLKDGDKAYLSRRQFSKKQVLEIINTMVEKNSDIELGERLKRELNLT